MQKSAGSAYTDEMQSHHQAPNMTAQVLHLCAGDDLVLQYLGAAVVLQWSSLPELLKNSILQQANSVGGLAFADGLDGGITALIGRARS